MFQSASAKHKPCAIQAQAEHSKNNSASFKINSQTTINLWFCSSLDGSSVTLWLIKILPSALIKSILDWILHLGLGSRPTSVFRWQLLFFLCLECSLLSWENKDSTLFLTRAGFCSFWSESLKLFGLWQEPSYSFTILSSIIAQILLSPIAAVSF